MIDQLQIEIVTAFTSKLVTTVAISVATSPKVNKEARLTMEPFMCFFVVSTYIELSAVVLQYHRKSPFSGWWRTNNKEE